MSEMEILVLGLCRTGTMSMKLALEQLGYKNVYHFFEVSENPSHPQLWIDALEAKYGRDKVEFKKWTSADWHELFKGYQAIADIPAVCFVPELLAAFPQAKIILTTRSSESWQRSMLETIHALYTSSFTRFTLFFSNEEARLSFQLLDLIIKYYFQGDISHHGIEVFEQHNEMVRRLAGDGKIVFLEYRMGDDWGPLCGFLGKEIPDVEFPRVNDSEAFRRYFGLGWNFSTIGAVLCVLLAMVAWGKYHVKVGEPLW